MVPITTDGSVPAAEDYAAAIQKLCEIKKNGVILCDSSEQSVLQVLKDKTQEASQNQRERVAVAAVPKSNAKSVAQSLNSERMVLCCQESGSSFAGEEKSVLFSAAAVAAMLAVSQPDDRFYSRKMEGLVSTEQLEESEIETLLQSGVTVLEEVESEVVCIRCVTTRTQTGGEEDRTFVSINTVLMIDDIIRAVRVQLSALLKDSRIGFSEDSIASQVAVILDEKVIPLTQQEIATTLKCSKMKINSMFSILQKQDYIEQKTRGKYVLTDKAENIIETIETLQ